MKELVGGMLLLALATACGGGEGVKAVPGADGAGATETASMGGSGGSTGPETTVTTTASTAVATASATASATGGGFAGEGGDSSESTEASVETATVGAGGTGASSETEAATTGAVEIELEIVEPEAGAEIFCLEAESSGPGCQVSFLVCSSGIAPIESGNEEYEPIADRDCPEEKPYGARFTRRVADSSESDGDWIGPTTATVASLGAEADVELWVDSDAPSVEMAGSEGGNPSSQWFWCPNGMTSLNPNPPTTTDPFWVKLGPGVIDSITLTSVTEQGVMLSENYSNLVYDESSPHWVAMGAVAIDAGVNTIAATITKPTGNSRTSPVCTVTAN